MYQQNQLETPPGRLTRCFPLEKPSKHNREGGEGWRSHHVGHRPTVNQGLHQVAVSVDEVRQVLAGHAVDTTYLTPWPAIKHEPTRPVFNRCSVSVSLCQPLPASLSPSIMNSKLIACALVVLAVVSTSMAATCKLMTAHNMFDEIWVFECEWVDVHECREK